MWGPSLAAMACAHPAWHSAVLEGKASILGPLPAEPLCDKSSGAGVAAARWMTWVGQSMNGMGTLSSMID